MRQLNDWTAEFLPNAGGCPRPLGPVRLRGRRVARLMERVLRTPVGGCVERLEWARCERQLPAQCADPREVVYSADCVKGHFDGWGQRILAAYAERVSTVGAGP
jgi:hypothetical protein